MKNYHKFLLIGVTLLIGLSLLPLVADAFSQKFGWEGFANVYQDLKVFIPIIMQ